MLNLIIIGNIHGINYLNISSWDFYKIINATITQLFLEYNINFLETGKHRFQILIYIKSLNKTFLLAFDTIPNDYIRSIDIILISIYECDKIKNTCSYSKSGIIQSDALNKIVLENNLNINWLSTITVN